MDYAAASQKQTLSALRASPHGLSQPEAARRLAAVGTNSLRSQHRGQLLRKIIAPFISAFVVILVIGAAISVSTGHRNDAIIIIIVIMINAAIEWGQQLSASRVLASLRRYSAKIVKVRRSGRVIEVDSTLIVPGDIVLIAQGEKVPADGRLLEATDLAIDESVLTGESLPVRKHIQGLARSVPLYQQTNMVFSGTVVATGRAEFCVVATGNQTAFGKIAKLADQPESRAPIYQKIRSLTLGLVIGTLVMAAAVIALGLLQGYGLAEMLRFAVALIVSVIPEGLPVTLTIILLLGIQRMAARKAFVRNLPAVETLGMVTAIATDKTGTLTQNSLSIAATWDLDGSLSTADNTDFWLSVSHRHPDLYHPIEKIITEYAQARGIISGWQEIADIPFDPKRRFTTVLWQQGSLWRAYIKGAPEEVLAKCRLNPRQTTQVQKQLATMAASGMRVIAVAKKALKTRPDLAAAGFSEMDFEGLIGFRDQLRPEAAAAIQQTRQAGVSVYMLTGDHLATARTIGKQLGLIERAGQIADGSVIGNASVQKLAALLQRVRVFGRVIPEHKYRLLEALKRTHITAMTGDGVNDAPALTKADVGVAMGSGTDAAKEAADIVLLDDNYSTIVKAIAAGRTIYANIRKMVYYQLSTNFAEALTIVFGLLLGLPLPLTAAQVLWLNIVTDTTMIIPLGLEPAESKQMQQPPRKPNESLLSQHLLARLVLMVVVMAAMSLGVFRLFLDQGVALAQTMAFLSLCAVQWAAAFNARSETDYAWQRFLNPNLYLFAGMGVGLILILLVIYGPLQAYMGTVAVSGRQALLLLPVFLLTLLISDLHKFIFKRR